MLECTDHADNSLSSETDLRNLRIPYEAGPAGKHFSLTVPTKSAESAGSVRRAPALKLRRKRKLRRRRLEKRCPNSRAKTTAVHEQVTFGYNNSRLGYTCLVGSLQF